MIMGPDRFYHNFHNFAEKLNPDLRIMQIKQINKYARLN